ncbi:hypothetical protein PQQ51_13225 [Paraburkholderia xenovorans]|uniref:hypothetical protein n=1 Tax=Paraburkholderia xenovorans TaxID=36873 RepID=UPI0038BC5E9C
MAIEQVLRQADKIGIEYKRIHICACRELDESAELNCRNKKIDAVVNGAVVEGSVDDSNAVNSGICNISHLITLITLDTETGTVEETVQGIILKGSGEYRDIDATAADNLSIPGYDNLSWGTSEYSPQISDEVVDQSVTRKSTTTTSQPFRTSKSGIYFREGIDLEHRNEKFYYLMKDSLDIDFVLDLIYGSANQKIKVATASMNLGVNRGKIVVSQINKQVSVHPGAELEFQSLYRVGKRETLYSISRSVLGPGNLEELVNVNVDLPTLSEIINPPDVGASSHLPSRFSAHAQALISEGTVIRLPLKVELGFDIYKQRGESAYDFLAEAFYGYTSENLKAVLRDWNARSLLASGYKIEDNHPSENGKYVYFGPP